MHGVTPLGLAAWLNIPEVVKLLLEECSGLVSADGMDALGATPLMCESMSALPPRSLLADCHNSHADAARDGNVAVVQCLVCDLLGVNSIVSTNVEAADAWCSPGLPRREPLYIYPTCSPSPSSAMAVRKLSSQT